MRQVRNPSPLDTLMAPIPSAHSAEFHILARNPNSNLLPPWGQRFLILSLILSISHFPIIRHGVGFDIPLGVGDFGCHCGPSSLLCGHAGDLSGWLRSAPSFWKHLAHMCLTVTSFPLTFLVCGAVCLHAFNWKSLHHHVMGFSCPRSRVRMLPVLPIPVFLLFCPDCLKPNLADQSTLPGFSKTIFSTCRKLESQVASPDSIFPNVTACRWSSFDHSIYCALYAVVFNICILHWASAWDIPPPIMISSSPATKSPSGNFLYSMFSPLHPHKYSGCNAAWGYHCLLTIVSIALSLIPDCTLPSCFRSLTCRSLSLLSLLSTRAYDFFLPRLLSRLASENAPAPLSELSGPVDVPGDGEASRRLDKPTMRSSTRERGSSAVVVAGFCWLRCCRLVDERPWPCGLRAGSLEVRDDARDCPRLLASDADDNWSLCSRILRSCATFSARNFTISRCNSSALLSLFRALCLCLSSSSSAASSPMSVVSSSVVTLLTWPVRISDPLTIHATVRTATGVLVVWCGLPNRLHKRGIALVFPTTGPRIHKARYRITNTPRFPGVIVLPTPAFNAR